MEHPNCQARKDEHLERFYQHCERGTCTPEGRICRELEKRGEIIICRQLALLSQ
jgi:hypothetical protein